MSKDQKDPKEDINKLNEIINSGNFQNVHLLCGKEDYLRLQFKDKLVKAMGGEPGSMSFDRFVGKDTVPEKIIDLAETLPFFTDRRVILLEDTGWFKSGCETMVKYIEEGVCESTCIVFCEKETDGKTKLYKTVSKLGMISDFDTPDERTLISWVSGNMRKSGVEISGADASYMVNMVGADMVKLSAEMDKLSAYCMGREKVTKADIEAICIRQPESRVFAISDALSRNNRAQALSIYFDLMSQKNNTSIGILALITRHYNSLLAIKDLMLRNCSDDVIASKTKKPKFTLRDYKSQASKYSFHQLKDIVDKCLETDMNIKSGRINGDIAVESLIVQLSEGRR